MALVQSPAEPQPSALSCTLRTNRKGVDGLLKLPLPRISSPPRTWMGNVLPARPSSHAYQISSLVEYLGFQLSPLPVSAPWVLPKRPPSRLCVFQLWKWGCLLQAGVRCCYLVPCRMLTAQTAPWRTAQETHPTSHAGTGPRVPMEEFMTPASSHGKNAKPPAGFTMVDVSKPPHPQAVTQHWGLNPNKQHRKGLQVGAGRISCYSWCSALFALLQPLFSCTAACQILRFASLLLIALLPQPSSPCCFPASRNSPPGGAWRHQDQDACLLPPHRLRCTAALLKQPALSSAGSHGSRGLQAPAHGPWLLGTLAARDTLLLTATAQEGEAEAGQACRSAAGDIGISSPPPPSPKGGENSPVIPQGCQGDICWLLCYPSR